MSSVHGQASAEYAGLLAVAVVLGSALALIAGPPLAGAVRGALEAALSGSSHPGAVVASAADIADVESALAPDAGALTPDAALLALGRRHGATGAEEVADAVLMSAARAAAPWIGQARTYRAWLHLEDGPYQEFIGNDGDRDIERPTGAPGVVWVTVAGQRQTLAAALAHHANATVIALDLISLIPEAGVLRSLGEAGARRAAKVAVKGLPDAIDTARTASGVVDVVNADDGDIPAGMRAGDVLVFWPVQRTFWRAGHSDPAARVDLGHGLGSQPPASEYLHVVFLRPAARGLAVVSEGFGT